MFETISLPEIPKSDDETTHPHHPDSESSTIHDFIHSVLFITENKHFFPSFPISGESTPFDKTSPIDDRPDSKGPDSRVIFPRNSIHVDEIPNDSVQNHPDSNSITLSSPFHPFHCPDDFSANTLFKSLQTASVEWRMWNSARTMIISNWLIQERQ
ncbi:hypothetical protein BLNAU_21055 [Blattamonas nauphoetae]|uniref:Uncharacterized protein n=1 Tax=Blattamonas nauphoetae TaxID=2049346 RepID=A0ABQ9WX24_9EUKA|nr:hypothetical protein BLNAU_21055 [Blattamonas nauphoetae]